MIKNVCIEWLIIVTFTVLILLLKLMLREKHLFLDGEENAKIGPSMWCNPWMP